MGFVCLVQLFVGIFWLIGGLAGVGLEYFFCLGFCFVWVFFY